MQTRTITAIILTLGLAPVLMGAGTPSKSEKPKSTPTYVKYYNSGVKAQNQKDYRKAAGWYKQALKEKKDFPDALNNLGFSLRKISESYTAEAVAAYRKALKFDPNHEQALEYQGELHLLKGELLKANAVYQRLNKLNSKEGKRLKKILDKILAEAKQLI